MVLVVVGVLKKHVLDIAYGHITDAYGCMTPAESLLCDICVYIYMYTYIPGIYTYMYVKPFEGGPTLPPQATQHISLCQ